MDRLTIQYCGKYVPKELCSIDRFGGADDCDLCCEYCKATEEGYEDCTSCAINKCFNRLGEYEDLEKQGLLLKLPCKVGTMVYRIFMDCPHDYKPEYCTDHEGSCEKCHHRVPIIMRSIFSLQHIQDIGKTVFLTQAEAEEALKKMEGVNETD